MLEQPEEVTKAPIGASAPVEGKQVGEVKLTCNPNARPKFLSLDAGMVYVSRGDGGFGATWMWSR